MAATLRKVSISVAYAIGALVLAVAVGHEYVKFHPAKQELKAPVEKFSCKRVSSDHPNYLTQQALCTIEMELAANVG